MYELNKLADESTWIDAQVASFIWAEYHITHNDANSITAYRQAYDWVNSIEVIQNE